MIPENSSTHHKYLDTSESINHSKQSGNYKLKQAKNTKVGSNKLADIHNDKDENENQKKQEGKFEQHHLKNITNQQSNLKKHPSSSNINHFQKGKISNPPTEKVQQKEGEVLSSHGKYSNKIQNFHLEQASTIRPSIFQEDYNHHFSQSKPLQIKNHIEEQYNPSNIKNRNHHLKNGKNGDTRYQSAIPSLKQQQPIIDADPQTSIQKKRVRKLPSIASNSQHFLSLHESSNIILRNIDGKNHSQIFNQKTVFTPISSSEHFDFTREKKCGLNYYYPLYTIEKQGVPLISARKQACGFNSTYLIKSGERQNAVTGYLKGNFSGTEFNLYQNNSERLTQDLVCTIIYDISCGCGPSFRRSEVYISNSKNNAMFEGQTRRKNLKTLYEQGYTSQIYKLKTKEPIWNENKKCYTMSFGGRGKVASIKNMILVSEQKQQSKKFLFCKASENKFYIEAKNPLNLFTIMGILMSSFDFKLLCQ